MTKEGDTVSEHTKEPWAVQYDEILLPEIVSGYGVVIPALRNADKDLCRIVLCVNACAGLDESVLHNSNILTLTANLDEAAKKIEELEARNAALEQRNELLAEEAKKYHDQLLECKNRWHMLEQQLAASEQQRGELVEALQKIAAYVQHDAGAIARRALAKSQGVENTRPESPLDSCKSCGSDRITVWNVDAGQQQAVCKDCKQTGNAKPTWEEAVSDWNAKSQVDV